MRLDTFQVVARLPDSLTSLREMAFNLLWSWDEEMRSIFLRLDRRTWEESEQNPVLTLGRVSQARLDALAQDEGFKAMYQRICDHYRDYLRESSWWDRRHGVRPLIAYFSAEYGLTECLPLYSGGLGVLAAHHLKSASDLGVPLVGVGLLYQQGYFRQYLTADGWQQESFRPNDFYNMPVQLVTDAEGKARQIEVDLAGQTLRARIWRATVGRLPLYLLDSNVPDNPKELQDITNQLYGGDHENRLRQEVLLGIGGLRALEAMGLDPDVCHMNEGHSAFLSLERIRTLMQRGVDFRAALEAARAGNIFTTHTPVPAGFDVFPAELMDKYFARYREQVGISRREFLSLGQAGPGEAGFNMAGLALRTSAFVNAVSRLHEQVSRRLLSHYTQNIPQRDLPIGHVTNGAHTRSCVSKEMAGLFDRYLGPEWWRQPREADTWQSVDAIPDEELWATHERRRERLVAFARRRLMQQLERRGGSPRDIERARGVLDVRALTIGFARRFATYKRATLLLHDAERVGRIVRDSARPVQFIFAGKAHPRDNEGKEVLKTLVSFCQREENRSHAVFLEDYDLTMARYLVQGCDVWLNTPRRGEEASGTSGMKVLPNGGLNVSVLDGWWGEAYQPGLGWAIGKGEDYVDHAYQDHVESNALYELLEKEIVPLFYTRGADGLPRGWIARMKESMRLLSPAFSTNRMVGEYADRYYVPAAEFFGRLSADGLARARALAVWKDAIFKAWPEVRIERVEARDNATHRVGDGFAVVATIRLGKIKPGDVLAEIYYGRLDAQQQIVEPRSVPMEFVASPEAGVHTYRGTITCDTTGLVGYTVRVRPAHPDANNVLCTGLMTWR